MATAVRYPASIVVPTMMNIDQPKESSNEVTMMSERNTVKNITPVIMLWLLSEFFMIVVLNHW